MKRLRDFLPQPHPTKGIFADHNIPIAAVANYLGLSTNYTCTLLTGFGRVSGDNDRKLREFARLVQDEGRRKK